VRAPLPSHNFRSVVGAPRRVLVHGRGES